VAGIGRGDREVQFAIRTPGEGTDRYRGKVGWRWRGLFIFRGDAAWLLRSQKEREREGERQGSQAGTNGGPSRWRENSPLCVQEALRRGRVEREKEREREREKRERKRADTA